MESQSGRSIPVKQRWIILFAAVVALYLIAQITRAQDAPITQDSTPLPTDAALATGIPTDERLLENSNLTEIPMTSAPAELTALPSDESAAALTPTDESTLEDDGVTDISTTPVTPESTALVTDDPTLEPTDEATLDLIPANIGIAASMSQVSDSKLLTLTISAEGLSDVYRVAVACQVDPTVLQGTQASAGGVFGDLSNVTDTGFQADGLWILIGKQADSAPSLAKDGTLWSIDYQVVQSSVTQIVCQAEIGDRNDQALPLANPNQVLTIEGDEAVTEIAPPMTSTAEAEVTLTPVATEELTEAPEMTPTLDTLNDPFHISGLIEANLPFRQALVTVKGATLDQVITVQSNGTFSTDLPAGDYQFIFTALYCLPRVVPVTIADKPMRLPTITLTGGDVDQNGVIDIADALLVTRNFGSAGSLPMSSVDLNGDGVVNIYDLVLVSASIH